MINALPIDTLVVVDPAYPAAYRQPYRQMIRHKQCDYIPIGANISRVDLSTEQKTMIRKGFASEAHRMIVYFGFATHHKGIEVIFHAANPDNDRLVLICELDPHDSYQASIICLAESKKWKGKCTVAGYVEEQEAASILASADAVVLPFIEGATPRNGSLLAARLQGTFVVTTHTEFHGYNASEHTYYASPGNVNEIRDALQIYAGKRFNGNPGIAGWDDIAVKHFKLYDRLIGRDSVVRDEGVGRTS
jgi:glycosyltransferase involved in cell wall biosynthesis